MDVRLREAVVLVAEPTAAASLEDRVDICERDRVQVRVIVFLEAAPPTASMVVVLSHMARKARSANTRMLRIACSTSETITA